MNYFWTIYAIAAPLAGIGYIGYHARKGTMYYRNNTMIAGAAFMLAVTPLTPQLRERVVAENSYCSRLDYVAAQDHCLFVDRHWHLPTEVPPDSAVTEDESAVAPS